MLQAVTIPNADISNIVTFVNVAFSGGSRPVMVRIPPSNGEDPAQ